MRRGISPIVSVVLLIAIAIVSAVGLYFWAGGLATKQATPDVPIVISAMPVDAATGKILIANLGSRELTDATFYLAGDESKNCTVTIPAGQQGLCEIDGAGQGQGGFGGTRVLIGASGGGAAAAMVEAPADTTAPPVPADFEAFAMINDDDCFDAGGGVKENRSKLTWTPLTGADLTDFREYRLYRNDTLILTLGQMDMFGETDIPDDPNGACTYTHLDGNTTVAAHYRLDVVDNSGNVGSTDTTADIIVPRDTICQMPVRCPWPVFAINIDSMPVLL